MHSHKIFIILLILLLILFLLPGATSWSQVASTTYAPKVKYESPTGGDIVYVRSSLYFPRVPPGYTAINRVCCPAGYQIIGGGGFATNWEDFVLNTSQPRHCEDPEDPGCDDCGGRDLWSVYVLNVSGEYYETNVISRAVCKKK